MSFATHASVALTTREEEQLEYEVILRAPLAVVAAPGHRLAAEAPLPLAALTHQPLIWFARRYDPTTYDYMIRLFARAGFRPQVVQEINQLPVLVGLVAAGVGITLLPEATAALAGESVIYLPFAEPKPQIEFDLVWRRDDPSPLVRAFLEAAREIAAVEAW